MITRIEATRYRCFAKLDVELGDYRVLVGANGSGKSTLLDIPVLLGDLLRERSLGSAFTKGYDGRAPRATAFGELLFQEQGDSFTLAVEAALPEGVVRDLVESMPVKSRGNPELWPKHLRYELRLQLFNQTELQVQNEYLFAFPPAYPPAREGADESAARLQGEVGAKRHWRFILRREYGGESEYTQETAIRPKKTRTQVAPQQLALARVQFDSPTDFPAARWLLDLLVEDAVFFKPDWNQLRMPSPPGMPKKLIGSGRNAPWLALELERNDPRRFALWKDHVHLALPQVTGVEVLEQEDHHHAYFRVRFCDGYSVPSSGLSDGTLRILVLTLLAYIAQPPRYLVTEEPENGLHPRAIEAVIQGLSSIYDSQVLVSSHSPVVLARTELTQILAARINRDGAAEVVPGPAHPRLADWKGDVSLGTLFAAGVLG